MQYIAPFLLSFGVGYCVYIFFEYYLGMKTRKEYEQRAHDALEKYLNKYHH